MPVNLVPVNISGEKAVELGNWLCKTFEFAVTARQNQIDAKYKRWVDNYAGKPLQETRTTPFYKASNFVPQLIRMHTDILAARLIGLLFGTRPFWRPKSFLAEMPHEQTEAASKWLDALCFGRINFYEPIDLSMFLTVKTGATVLKGSWEMFERFYGASQGQVTGEVSKKREDLRLDVIPYDDFFPWPVTSRNLSQCIAKFQRLRFSKPEVEFRKNSRVWDPANASKLLLPPNRESSPARESSAQQAGITLTVDTARPYTAVEAWFDYELSPGKLFPLFAVFNPYVKGKDTFLRLFHAYYTEIGLDPFVDFRILPREDLFQGYSIPEILEQAQEEQAQIHNSRRDANTIVNMPGWKKKRLAEGLGNPSTEWYPGKVFELDNMDDLEPLAFGMSYNSLVEEEQFLMGLTERYTGISPAMQGFGSGPMMKRGIYASQATMALLTEGNKRLDIYLKRMRMSFHGLGRLIWSSYRDFSTKEFLKYGSNGQQLAQLFQQSSANPDQIFFELGASDASANKEVDRQNILLMSQTMSAYYGQIIQLGQGLMSMQPNTPAFNLALQVLEGAQDLAKRILFLFDIPDSKRLVPDVREILGGGAPQSPAAQQAGVPQPEEPVSVSQLQGLADTLPSLTNSMRERIGGAGNNGSGGGLQ